MSFYGIVRQNMDKTSSDNRNVTFMLTLAALFAAVLAAASWISLPLPFTPIPANLGTLAVALAGALLGCRYGTFSVLVYILLGAAGVPVFAGFTGGFGHIAGPTGGYIIGYLTSAFICGAIVDLLYATQAHLPDMRACSSSSMKADCCEYQDDLRKKSWKTYAVTTAAALLGTVSCYALGTIWFIILTGSSLAASLAMCVIPFIPGDVFKIIAAAILIPALRPVLEKMKAR